MNQRKHGIKTIYTVLRQILRFFALFIAMILGVVAWSELWIKDRALASLERGELVSLGMLLAIALGLWFFAAKVKREIDKV